jgi:hypothetical protein
MDEITLTCDDGAHHLCDGYIAPLAFSNTKRCTCSCHAGIFGRDFTRAMRRAEKSYYGHAYYPAPVPHGKRREFAL